MKTWYVCERCGLKFETEKEALACEDKHKAEQERKDKLAKEKEERWDEVKKAYNNFADLQDKFYEDYSIKITNPTSIDCKTLMEKLLEI